MLQIQVFKSPKMAHKWQSYKKNQKIRSLWRSNPRHSVYFLYGPDEEYRMAGTKVSAFWICVEFPVDSNKLWNSLAALDSPENHQQSVDFGASIRGRCGG